MYRLFLFLSASLTAFCLSGQTVLVNKSFVEVMADDDVCEKDGLIKSSYHDTLVLTAPGDYQQPTCIFRFLDDTCVSQTVVFHKTKGMERYHTTTEDTSHKKVSLFKPFTKDNMNAIKEEQHLSWSERRKMRKACRKSRKKEEKIEDLHPYYYQGENDIRGALGLKKINIPNTPSVKDNNYDGRIRCPFNNFFKKFKDFPYLF